MQPLSGVRVVDFTQFLAGPYCTMLLADLGADVIKVERPGVGDDSRAMAPFVSGESYPFTMPNRNKRSVALDLKNVKGCEAARQLVAGADVVVENFRPGVMRRFGLDYESLYEPGGPLVYCSITGFGQTGPNHARPGFDIIAQGMAGFLRMTGQPDGPPMKSAVAVTDLAAGLTAANAVLGAYIHRLRSGEGQFIDVSLVEAGLALTVWEAGVYFGSGEEPVPTGTRHRRLAPYQAFRTADGHVTVGANNQRLWERFCIDVLRRGDLVDRPEYRDVEARRRCVDELEIELQAILVEHDTTFWVAALDVAGVPGGPVLTFAEAVHQDQAVSREVVTELDHPTMGRIKALAPAARLSQTPMRAQRAAPVLGQHTEEVLLEAGLPREAVDELLREGAVAQWQGSGA